MSKINDFCMQSFSESQKIGESDLANFYVDDNLVIKVFKGKCQDYQHTEFLNELYQSSMIEELVKKKSLNQNYYLKMVSAYDCCDFDENSKLSSIIIFPKYQYSFQHLLLNDKNVEKLKHIISQILTAYIILYQVTEMTHGNFTHNNILIDTKGDVNETNIVIGGFGKMEKKPCLDHIKEFFWFIISIRDYISGDFDLIKRPWLDQLLEPKIIKNLSEKNFFEIDIEISTTNSSIIDEVFKYWIK